MTELLYLKDSYKKEFFAKITKLHENKIALSKTAFYPQGGGQPSDSGKIFVNQKEFEVLKVQKEEGEVWHYLNSTADLEKDTEVNGRINWEKRFNFMRMHTSAHILAAVLFEKTKKLITGNQIGWPDSRMDFNVPESFNTESVKEIESFSNNKIALNQEVIVSFLQREEALKKPELFRLKDLMPPSLKEWRIVQIGSIDLQADGGTHVKNTSEIGSLKIIKTQNKGANNKRIYWTLQ